MRCGSPELAATVRDDDVRHLRWLRTKPGGRPVDAAMLLLLARRNA